MGKSRKIPQKYKKFYPIFRQRGKKFWFNAEINGETYGLRTPEVRGFAAGEPHELQYKKDVENFLQQKSMVKLHKLGEKKKKVLKNEIIKKYLYTI